MIKIIVQFCGVNVCEHKNLFLMSVLSQIHNGALTLGCHCLGETELKLFKSPQSLSGIACLRMAVIKLSLKEFQNKTQRNS